MQGKIVAPSLNNGKKVRRRVARRGARKATPAVGAHLGQVIGESRGMLKFAAVDPLMEL